MADVFASVAPAPAAPTDPSTETSGRNYTNAKQTPARRAPANDEVLSGATNGIADQVRGINSTLAADRAKIEAMEAKPPILTPPPPKHADTDPFQAFGQPAMWLAMFGSLLTRNHLTSAITSAAGVLKATHDLDAESAKQNYESWKVTSENAIKLAKFEQDAYSHAIQKYRADSQAGTAEMEVLFKAYRNAALQHVFETEGMPGVIKYFEHSGNNAELAGKRQAELNDYLEKQKDHVTAIKAWDAANPGSDPVVRNAAVSAIRAGHDPSATKVSQWSLVDTPSGQLRYREGPNGPEYSNLDGTPAQAPETAHKSGTAPKPKAGDEARNERNDMAMIAFKKEFGRDYDEATASDEDRANFYRLRHTAISTARTESTPVKPGSEYSRPQQIEVDNPDGSKRTVVAQQNKSGGGWVTADEKHTPIDAAGLRLMQPNELAPPKPGTAAYERANRFSLVKNRQIEDGSYKNDLSVYDEVNREMFLSKSASFTPGTAEMVADQIIAGNSAAASGFGRSPQLLSQLDAALLKRMNEHHPPLTGADMARIKVEYAAYSQGTKAFEAGGSLEPVRRSLNVVVEHLGTLEDAVAALSKNDTTALNRAMNFYKQQTGYAGPSTFDAIRGLVAGEINKAVTSSGGAVSDREDLKEQLNRSMSPDQISSAIKAYEALMGGQIGGLRLSYDRVQELGGQPKGRFDERYLSEKARSVLVGRPSGLTDEQIIDKAKERIGRDPGARNAVVDTLKGWGVPTDGM